MKQVIKNRYLKSFKFLSSQEALVFFNNQKTKNCLSIDDEIGDNYYCYICYDSLTKDKQFVLSFSSEDNEDDLNFLFWDERKMLVLDSGNNIYLIDENLNIRASFELTTPLIGLHLINNDKLLLLEEAFMRVVDYKGKVLESKLFDLIENFSLEDTCLSIQTRDGNEIIELV